ncbi:hypothetical protein REPUB_Repub12eG0094400 [Reevesia pubescens]
MAPKKMKQVAMKPEVKKNLKVRVEIKRVKAEMGKILEDKEIECIREEQRKIRVRYEEIRRQCDELKEETEMIKKQIARNRIKLVLMSKILKAQEGGDLIEAVSLTHSLREFIAKGNSKCIASLANVKNENP